MESFEKIATALLGASGWVAVAFTIWKSKQESKEKEAKILQEVTKEIGDSYLYKRIIQILKDEQEGKEILNPLPGWKMRQLPAFLESLASHWEYKFVSIESAYKTVGEPLKNCVF